MKKLIIAISSIVLLATSAMSFELSPSIGISGNKGVYAATGIERNFNEGGTAIDTTTTEHGAFTDDFASIFVEIALNDALSLGVDYVPMAIETPQNVANINEGNENKVRAEFDHLTTIYAKLNIPLGGLYLKAGYSQVDVTSIETNSNSYGDDSTSGATVGLGYNHEIDNGLSIRAEITGSQFENVETNNGQTNKVEIEVEDMIGARGTISLVKSF